MNASNTMTMTVFGSRTMHPQSLYLITVGTVQNEYVDRNILGVKFDSKMMFEKHLRLVSKQLLKNLVS